MHLRRELNDMNITFPNPSVEWTPESGFPDDAPPDGFPWRPQGQNCKLHKNISDVFIQ